ncbi:hypothetical protein, partial [Streptomyces sp. NPDC088135]|uniref:hypothetical protein n=1 Tax=Streptomyces sp. NPDC088135 TaxID=3160993 RepID=UPI0034296970
MDALVIALMNASVNMSLYVQSLVPGAGPDLPKSRRLDAEVLLQRPLPVRGGLHRPPGPDP